MNVVCKYIGTHVTIGVRDANIVSIRVKTYTSSKEYKANACITLYTAWLG